MFRNWRGRRILKVLLLLFLLIFILRAASDIRGDRQPSGRSIKWWQGLFRQDDKPTKLASSNIPTEYSNLYSLLDNKLTVYNQKIESNWNKQKGSTVFSAGLITANPNAGDLLLQPSTHETTTKYLDRLSGMGIKGVAVDINFPLLDPQFYSDQSKYETYLNFYKKLFGEIEKRGMVAEVEVQPIFPDYSTLDVKPYFKSLTFDKYKERVLVMLKTIKTELKPAYLTVANEPDTAEHNSGQPLGDLNNFIGAVDYWVNALSYEPGGTQLGAGFGTWYKNYKEASTRLVEIKNIDFINIHVYPVDGDLLDRTLEIADIATQNGKSSAIHESWLYKWKIGERSSGGIGAAGEIYGRDIFDFWQPLDQKFIQALVNTGHYKNMEYVSFFWSNYFFHYFSFDEGSAIPDKQRMTKAMIEGAKEAAEGKITETGRFYQNLIRQ